MESSTYRNKLEHYLDNHISHNRLFIEHNPDGIFALDRDGYFIRINNAFETITGYPKETLLYSNFNTLYLKEAKKVHAHFQKALHGELQTYDTSFLNQNGEILYVNITNIPIKLDDEIIGVFGIAKNMTAFKHKQKQLEQSHDIYRFLTNHSLDIIIQTSATGYINYVSKSCHSVLGYEPEELTGSFCGEIIHADDLRFLIDSHFSLLTENQFNTLQFRLKHKDGHYIWVESQSSPMKSPETGRNDGVISVIRDIHERVTREANYKEIIKHTPDAILIADNEDILFVNDQFLELVEAENIEEVAERGVYPFVIPEHRPLVEERIWKVNQGEISDFIELKFQTLSGKIIEVESKAIPTVYQNKKARHIIVRDITERLKTQELLLKSEKLSVAGQLAAGIAHEVRNPLTSIRGFIQLLERKDHDSKTDYFRIIYTEIDRINQILSELLTLAKPQDTHFKTQSLNELLEEVEILLGTQAAMKNVMINTQIHSDDPITIHCDENQMKQVFINFVKNSIEAMPHGGTILIDVSLLGTDGVTLSFIDQGTGIPKDILNRIGEPFFTTKENGTGLGLMICKQIIDNHNGNFEIKSTEKGTTITITLPMEIK